MIYFDENSREYKFSKYKINYTHNDETVEKFVGAEGIDWWKSFEATWDNMKINSITEVKPNEQQIARLEDIKKLSISEGFQADISEYVDFGKFSNEFIPDALRVLQLTKQLEEYEEALEIALGGATDETDR